VLEARTGARAGDVTAALAGASRQCGADPARPVTSFPAGLIPQGANRGPKWTSGSSKSRGACQLSDIGRQTFPCGLMAVVSAEAHASRRGANIAGTRTELLGRGACENSSSRLFRAEGFTDQRSVVYFVNRRKTRHESELEQR